MDTLPQCCHNVATMLPLRCHNVIAVRSLIIPAKPLPNHNIVSVHFNHFYYAEICDIELSSELAMFTYISQCGWVSILGWVPAVMT